MIFFLRNIGVVEFDTKRPNFRAMVPLEQFITYKQFLVTMLSKNEQGFTKFKSPLIKDVEDVPQVP